MTSGTLTLGPGAGSLHDLQQRRAAAERFIEQSGDGAAVRALGELRRDPTRWQERLAAAAMHQTTLKIALGVFAGVVGAEAALAVLRSGVLADLCRDIDAALDGIFTASGARHDSTSMADSGPVAQPAGSAIPALSEPTHASPREGCEDRSSPADDSDPTVPDFGSLLDDWLS